MGFLLLALAGYGFYRLCAHRRLIVLYVATTAGIVFLWPQAWSGTRFIQPLIPLLLLAVCNGLYTLFAWGVQKAGYSWKFQPLLLLLPLCFVFIPDIDYLHKRVTIGRLTNKWVNYYALADWVKKHTEPEAIVACRKPNLFYLHSNRRAVLYKFTDDPALLLEDLVQKQVNYVVIDQLGWATLEYYLLPALVQYEDQFSLVHEFEKSRYLAG